ncbi:hypothetical protein HJ588_03395 [Flexivirga sp. ID2601S]|uniref:Uncharacterized protein n=1 Tax=Flexivirga aerilata TaxID=1656889 RepID=A0A849ACX2_9MICO|nr:hypothetical protein [Flexivirga aerilata]NNG38319.1 hypothetical protein [Flexivirga aerilata]
MPSRSRAGLGTPEERERLSDAYELRFHGEGGPLSGALFGAYLAGLLGIVYGSVLAHYVFDQWPGVARWVEHRPAASIGVILALIVAAAAIAFRVGRTRGPVLPEPGHIELVVATDLPRRLTLRDAWRGAQLVVLVSCVCLGVAVPAGLALSGGPGWSLAAGVLLGIVGGVAIVQAWLRGQAFGQVPSLRASSGSLIEALPAALLLRQSLLSEAVTSSLLIADTRRARAQAFPIALRRKPARIPTAGRWATVVLADLTGLLRSGWSVVAWTLAELAALLVLGSHAVLAADSPLVLPVLVLVAHLAATGLTRGLQHQAASVGEPSLLGLPWQHEAVLHLVPLAVVQCVAVTAAGLATGVGAAAAAYGVAVAAALAGSQLLYAHKEPLSGGLLLTGPGRGAGALWAMHPAILALAAGFGMTLGASTAVLAGLLLLAIGYARAAARFAPARVD